MIDLTNIAPEILVKIKELQTKQQIMPKYYLKVKPKPNCEVCGSTISLQRHHIKYDPPEVITVCYVCHCLLHGRELGLRGNGNYHYQDKREKWRVQKRKQRANKKGVILTTEEAKKLPVRQPDYYNPEATKEERQRAIWRRYKRVYRAKKKGLPYPSIVRPLKPICEETGVTLEEKRRAKWRRLKRAYREKLKVKVIEDKV